MRPAVAVWVAACVGAVGLWPVSADERPAGGAEFRFVRLEYRDQPGARRGFGRGWWRQDWPEAETHFAQGVRRLTAVDVGDGVHFGLADERLFDYPWVYATQVGYWNLGDEEIARLREYLLRGGFLMTDDFYGDRQWEVFRERWRGRFPTGRSSKSPTDDPTLHILFDLDRTIQIPGLRHLRRGPGGRTVAEPQDSGPHWRGVYDDEGRMMVAANYNMDIGDAWEHADWPEYPEPMTALAYRFGINYIVYAMTH